MIPLNSPSRRLTSRCAIALALLSLGATRLSAQDWASVGDESLRHHISYYDDATGSDVLTTTWPFVPQALLREIEAIDLTTLSAAERRSIEAIARRLNDPATITATALLGTGPTELRGFSNDYQSANELRLSLFTHQSNFIGRLTAAAIDDPLDSRSFTLDDSYLAVDWGNWRFGAGSIDRWWGPGWQSSLILSNNARPAPGVFVSRANSERLEFPVLRYLGPWHLTLFANQLESDRHIPEAKLLGGRFTFQPHPSLEIGLSRTAQWGGEGRPQDWDSLVNLLIGRDNIGSSGIDRSNEPGNQLGGIDLRWSGNIADRRFALYGQLIGEDEAGGFPSRKIGMLGIETPIVTDLSHGRLFLEVSDTTMDFWDDGGMPNGAYEHSIYQSGYRYYGRSIGASSDNDSRVLAIGGYHEFGTADSFTWKALHASLNRDGTAAGNTIAPTHMKTGMLTAEYARRLSDTSTLQVLGYYLTDEIIPSVDLSKAGVQVAFTLSR